MTDARSAFAVRPLTAADATIEALAALLVETVAAGGSVSFLHPLALDDARAFWRGAFDQMTRGRRVVFGACENGELLGTLTLLLDCPPNQPHRAEFAKMMTAPRQRGRGVATALIEAAEAEAIRRGRTLIVLDTASDGGAGPLYERCGFRLAGEVPGYALKPHGGLTGTLYYYKPIGGAG